MLGWLGSPQQIAQISRTMWPDKRELHVAHEFIYTPLYAYPKGELRKDLIAAIVKARAVANRAPVVAIGDIKSPRWSASN